MMHTEGGKDHVKSGVEIRRRTGGKCGDARCFRSSLQEFWTQRGVTSDKVEKLHENRQCMTDVSQN